MPLDPLTALGLAANIVQFIEFCDNLSVKAYEIYKATEGLTKDHEHHQNLVQSLAELSGRLKLDLSPTASPSANDQALQDLAQKCEKEANDLLSLLKSLAVPGDSSVWRSTQQAFRGLRKNDKIKSLSGRLKDYRGQISVLLLAILSEKGTSVNKTLQQLLDQNHRLDIQRTAQLNSIQATLNSISQSTSKTLSASNFGELHVKITTLLDTVPVFAQEQQIIASLRFPEFRTRHAAIQDAHAKTFRWMFEKAPPEENMPDIKFVEWLQSSNPNDSLYWISGKAGSGKSTLMKYILAHQETSASLKAWAAGHNLVIASFFFWHSGTDMQKSQTGLFQSLLFEILRASPDVIQDLLPIRWTETTQEPWTKTELRQVLSSLSEKLRSSARFCFLIDGIDEYCGEACDIMDAVQDLSKPENVKVCCSSRPWSVFKEGLDKDTKRRLYLQDLTRADIQRYVSTKLEANANFVTANYEDERHQQIINYVVENSQGVFLWVSLVVRSLLRGLSNADTLDVLYDRLTRLPTDLNEFFDYMLRGIEVHYKRQSMYTFKVALKSRKTLLLVQYYALDDLQSNPNLALTLQTAPSTEGAKSKSIFEIGRNEIKMEKRLEARSKGLLEVVCESNDGRIAKRVGFLHRTVREFLTQPHIRQRIMDVTGDSFTGGLAMASSILSVIKLTPLGLRDRLENNLLSEMFDDFFVCFHQLSPEQHQTAIRTIDELQQVLETRYHSRFGQVDFRQLKMHDYRALDKRFLAKSQPRSVLEACALYHIDFYLEYRLRKDPSLSQAQFHRPLLSHVLLPWHLASGILLPGFPETSTVDILLRSGCDPNGKVDEGPDTVWTRFLSGWFRTQEEQSRSHNIGTSNRIRIHVTGYGKNLIRPLRSLIKRLLVSGADVNAINPRNTSSTFWGEIVNNMEEHDAVGADMRMHLLKLWLQHGADPNAEYREGYTVWKKRLVDLYQDRISGAPAFNCVDEVELFLQYGADPDVMLRLNNHNRRLEDVLDFLFPTLDIDQARHLAEVVREQRAKRSAPRFENETE